MPRPEELKGSTHVARTYCGNIYVTVNTDEGGEVVEVFAMLGKSGVCARHWTEALGRVVTKYLRIGGDAEEIAEQLKGIGCPEGWEQSCATRIGEIIKKYKKGE